MYGFQTGAVVDAERLAAGTARQGEVGEGDCAEGGFVFRSRLGVGGEEVLEVFGGEAGHGHGCHVEGVEGGGGAA